MLFSCSRIVSFCYDILVVEDTLNRRLRSVWSTRKYLNTIFTCTLIEPRCGRPWHNPYFLCHCFSSFSLFHIFSSCLFFFRPVSTITVAAHFHFTLLPFHIPVIFVYLRSFVVRLLLFRDLFLLFRYCVSIFSLISSLKTCHFQRGMPSLNGQCESRLRPHEP